MKPIRTSLSHRLRRAAALLAMAAAGPALAQSDLANAPLFTSSVTAVKPNIMFILDDSGSMAWDYMPDAASYFDSDEFGKYARHCNGLAYDPSATYLVPVDANGLSLGNAAIADWIAPKPSLQLERLKSVPTDIAKSSVDPGDEITIYINDRGNLNRRQTVTVYRDDNNYFVGKITGTNENYATIRVHRRVWATSDTQWTSSTFGEGEPVPGVYHTYKGTQPRLGFSYGSDGAVQGNAFFNECAATASFPSSLFDRVTVTAASPEAQNYANWGKYYRDRMITMKSATSVAFKGVDSRYRLGYSTISDKTAVEGSNFLDIRDFDATQKTSFYTRFNAAQPVGSTPLRGALAKAGQYFANKAPSQSRDPVQYSCQRNFTILSTDGMWNTGMETSTYGPYKLDGTTRVGQQDGDLPRPMLDGTSVVLTTVDSWTTTTVTTATDLYPRVQNTRAISSTVQDTITSRLQRTSYTAPRRHNVDEGAFTRPGRWCGSNCWVNVNISNHGYETGESVTITHGSESDYRGTFTVEKIDANNFRYKLSFRPGWPDGKYRVYPPETASCNAGQSARVIATFDEITRVIDSTVESTTVTFQVQDETTTTKYQTHTWTVQEVNGVQQAGVQADGPVQTSSVTNSTPTQTGTVTDTFTTTETQNLTDGWKTVSTNCASPGTESTVSVTPPTVAPWLTSSNPTTTTDGAKSTTVSQTVTESPRTTTTSTSSTGGVSDTLADVASYYYRTDLRTSGLGNCQGALGAGHDVCENKVPGRTADAYHSFGDAASWQHMTTFTLGLGVSGTLKFDQNYLTLRSGDFHKIVNRQLNWPTPDENLPSTIDDLWHAAVNGRGQYFSAADPVSLTNGLNSALAAIQAITGAASAASTSSLQPVEGDNDIYVAQFTTMEWVGDVLAYKIDPTNGSISSAPTWSAKEKLNAKDPTTRTIYYPRPGGGLSTFTYANLTTDGYASLFDNFCAKPSAGAAAAPDQCATFSSTDLTAANSGANLVSYLRGDQTLSYYRTRTARLGDVINASPLFVGKPGFKYAENGYQTFVADKANRTAIVLAAANDGMLHAFDRLTGEERWAFIPSFVMPNLYKLADNAYTSNHHYFVDGSPQIGDIYVGGAWKTIVVGGLNKGGRGYYALDVTNPASPQLLWEFRHDDLGYTYGNPIITKRTDGTWVVVFGSGYENVGPGDGNGHLFVVNANTGALVTKVSTFTDGASTPAGSAAAPSGLAKINTWVDSELVNTSRRFYGGDLQGNLWRFDIDNQVEPHGRALRLAQMRAPDGSTPQPITVKPALAEIEYNGGTYPVVYVPTGSYLRTSDPTNTTVQSIYAVKDPLTATGYGILRADTSFVVQSISAGADANGRPTRSSSNAPVDWSAKSGWRVDLPVGGERVSVNPQLALETLYVGSNLPNADACTVGGDSFLYQFNINTGVSTATYVGNVLVQGLTVVQLTTGAAAGSIVTIITRSDGSLQTEVGSPSSAAGTLRRTSWRELVD